MRSRCAGWPLGFLLTAVLLSPGLVWFGCGGGGGGSSAPAGAFSQADITGTWDVIQFFTGSGAGWMHVTVTFDASGSMTSFSNYVDSEGITDPGGSPDPPLKWTIDSSGVMSEFENGVDTGIRGRMSSDKKLVMNVETDDTSNTPYTISMVIARKRTGTVFSNNDAVNVPFVFHQLSSGQDNTWYRGAGSTNASRQLTLDNTTLIGPGGLDPNPPSPNFDTMSVSLAGIVTLANDNAFYGLMTDDKKVIFAIGGDINVQNGIYNLIVITVTGQTYTQSDFAGTFNFFTIRNNVPNPAWSYGVTSIDVDGNGTYLSYTDIGGGAAPGPFRRVLSASGVITDPDDITGHGQMSYNKDITVRTNTSAAGRYGMPIGFK